MRKIVIVPIIILIAVVGIANQVFSMGKKPPTKKYFVKEYPQSSHVSGKIARIDAARPAIIIATEDYKSLVLIVNSETKLLRYGKNIKLSEIKKGNLVRVDYEIVYKDKNIAKSIDVESGNMFEPKRKH